MGRPLPILTIVGTLSTCTVVRCAGRETGPLAPPVAHWSFDEIEDERTIRDQTGHGHHGTIVRSKRLEGPFRPTLRKGIRGQALRCGGSRQYGYYLTVPAPPKLAGPFTVCAWVRPAGGQWLVRIVYYKRSWHSHHGVELHMGGNRLLLVSYPDGPNGKAFKLPMKMPIQSKFWSFITIRWDGRDWRLYMNGMLVAEDRPAQYPYESPPAGTPLNIGGYTLHTNNTFTGLIDEVRIWPRALSAKEIEQVMLDDLP